MKMNRHDGAGEKGAGEKGAGDKGNRDYRRAAGFARSAVEDRDWDHEPPRWLGPALAVAQHQDRKASWAWYARLGHWLFISWRCPCCVRERQNRRRKS